METLPHNPVGWFEIPVNDMNRAAKFYETVFGFKVYIETMGPLLMGLLPGKPESMGSCGSLVYAPEFYTPSAEGTIIYFTAFSGDLTIELSRVEAAGGKILQNKTLITEEIGYMGTFLDTEGNKIAIHSRT